MDGLVCRKENQALANSRPVAMKFGKRHPNVIGDMEGLLAKLPGNGRKPNFGQLEEDAGIPNGGPKGLKPYAMAGTGFTLLAMGFAGEKAIQFKLGHTAAFNKMKETIKRAEKRAGGQEGKEALGTKAGGLPTENKGMEKRVGEDTPKVISAMAATGSKRPCLAAGLAKATCQNGMGTGRDRLPKRTRKKGYLGTKGEYYGQPMQRRAEARPL